MKTIALAQLAYDGINTYHCGVGTVVRNSLVAINSLNQDFKEFVHFRTYLLTPDYSKNLPSYSDCLLRANINFCHNTGGKVYLLPITDKDSQFGNIKQWRELCEKGKTACLEIIKNNLKSLIIAHDTAFAHLPLKLCKKARTRALWVPHCTTVLYDGKGRDPVRFQWENEAFKSASQLGYKVGYLGQFMKRHFQKEFGVEEKDLVPYRGGINTKALSQPLSQKTIISKLKQRNIPLNKKLVFIIGRGNSIKGHDIVLTLFHHLTQIVPDLHLVVLAPKTHEMPHYTNLLKKRKVELNLEATIIDEFDEQLPGCLYQWKETVLIPLLSRMDAHPLTVMEARVNPKNSIVLVSRNGGLPEQIDEGSDGFICDINLMDDVLRQALKIINLDNHEKLRIIENGKRKIMEKYDFRKNFLTTLKYFFPEQLRNLQ